jgi:hypothetical protein
MKVEFDPEKHQYKINGIIVPSVSDILGVDSEVFRQAEKRKGLPENYYADRGTAIHELTYKIDMNILYNVQEESGLSGYIEAWIKFKTDNNIKILEREMIVASEELMLAGTLDVLAEFNNHLWILDIKSGSETETHKTQVSAYRLLYVQDPRYYLLPKKIGCVYLRSNGKYSFREFEYDPFEVIYMRKKFEN